MMFENRRTPHQGFESPVGRAAQTVVFISLLALAGCDSGPADADAASPTDAGAEAADAPASSDAADATDTADATDAADAPGATDAADDGGSSGDAADAANAADTADTADTTDAGLPDGPWRSRLYPKDWTPYSDAGRIPGGDDSPGDLFLHDFSWAGYRHGKSTPGSQMPTGRFDVVADHGADATGASDATAAFQQAIDAAEAAGGGVVVVPPGTYRLDGTLRVQASNIVLSGEGPPKSRLFFTKSKGMSYRSHIEFQKKGGIKHGPSLKLAADGAIGDRRLAVQSLGDLQVGDDVAIGWTITPEFVAQHGMKDTWQAFNGKWQPFFRREVTAIDRGASPPVVEIDVPLRYPALTRDGADIRRETGLLREVGVQNLGLANAVGWDAAWKQDQVHALEFNGVEDGWIRQLRSFKPPAAASGRPASGSGSEDHLQSGGLIIRNSKRVTVADVHMKEAQNRGGGGNGYLFELRASSEVLTRDSVGEDGRHNFIQNWGFGVSGCVWLRVKSAGGVTLSSKNSSSGGLGYSEFHHSLAMANLIDASTFHDGWSAANRKAYSSGAGHTATQNVLWNVRGRGNLRSWQYGHGYVIGTGPGIRHFIDIPDHDLGPLTAWEGTAPRDWSEGLGRAEDLRPRSLYEDQLKRRKAAP